MVQIIIEDVETEEHFSVTIGSLGFQIARLFRLFREQHREAFNLLRQRYPRQCDFHYEFNGAQLTTNGIRTLRSFGIEDGSTVQIVPTAVEIIFYELETESEYPVLVGSLGFQIARLFHLFREQHREALNLLRQRYPRQCDFHYEFNGVRLMTNETSTLRSFGIEDGSTVQIVPTAVEIIIIEDVETEERFSVTAGSPDIQFANLVRFFREQHSEAFSLLRQRYPGLQDFHYEFSGLQLLSADENTLRSFGIEDGSIVQLVPTAVEITFYELETKSEYPIVVGSLGVQFRHLINCFFDEYEEFKRGTICFKFSNHYIPMKSTETLRELEIWEQSFVLIEPGPNPNFGVQKNAWSRDLGPVVDSSGGIEEILHNMIEIPAYYLRASEVAHVYIVLPLHEPAFSASFEDNPIGALFLFEHLGISQRQNLKIRMLENVKGFTEATHGVKVLYSFTKEDAEQNDVDSAYHMATGIEMLYKRFNHYYCHDHKPGTGNPEFDARATEQVENMPGIGNDIYEHLVKQLVDVIIHGEFFKL